LLKIPRLASCIFDTSKSEGKPALLRKTTSLLVLPLWCIRLPVPHPLCASESPLRVLLSEGLRASMVRPDLGLPLSRPPPSPQGHLRPQFSARALPASPAGASESWPGTFLQAHTTLVSGRTTGADLNFRINGLLQTPGFLLLAGIGDDRSGRVRCVQGRRVSSSVN
jgi:hypothetical protein